MQLDNQNEKKAPLAMREVILYKIGNRIVNSFHKVGKVIPGLTAKFYGPLSPVAVTFCKPP